MDQTVPVIQVVMTRQMLRAFQNLLTANGSMAVPLPEELVGEDELPTYVIWPLAQATAAGFTSENTLAFGHPKATTTEENQ